MEKEMLRLETESATGRVCLAVVGDMEINRADPGEVFANVLPELERADIRFGGIDPPLSDKGAPVQGKITLRSHPSMVAGYVAAGFDVLAFASNHCLDYGVDAFLETLEVLEKNHIHYTGAGRNIGEARRPALVERNGTRVGFLSYIQNLPLGYNAHPGKPGAAPVRQDPLFGPPYVNEEDLEAMKGDIERTKQRADVLVISCHWGASQSRTLTLSQQAVAHAAVDAGADLVIGHHPHILQGIEVYKGKVIFYALGNFVLDHDHPMFAPTVKESILVKCLIGGKQIQRISFVPILIGNDGKPRILNEGEDKCSEVIGIVRGLSGKLGTLLDVSGNEAVVLPQPRGASLNSPPREVEMMRSP